MMLCVVGCVRARDGATERWGVADGLGTRFSCRSPGEVEIPTPRITHFRGLRFDQIL